MHPAGAELFHADGWTQKERERETNGRRDKQRERDMSKIKVTPSHFANAHKKWFVDNK